MLRVNNANISDNFISTILVQYTKKIVTNKTEEIYGNINTKFNWRIDLIKCSNVEYTYLLNLPGLGRCVVLKLVKLFPGKTWIHSTTPISKIKNKRLNKY